MGWEQAKKAVEGSGGGNFLKLKDGQAVEGVFRGEPHTFYRQFPEKAEYSQWEEGRSFRFRINFVTKEADKYVAKVWEGGTESMRALFAAKEEYGMDCLYKIKREGASKDDTKYHVLYKAKLTPAQLKTIGSIKLSPTTSGRSRKEVEEEPPPLEDSDMPPEAMDDDQEIPF